MFHSTTTTPTHRHPLDTVETTVENEDGILLWVEDAPPAPKMWDRHVGERPGIMVRLSDEELEAMEEEQIGKDQSRRPYLY